MALKVRWSMQADQSYDRILEYLQAQWGENVKRAFVLRTQELLELLSQFPTIGSVENRNRQIRGLVLIKQVTVYYIRKKDSIVLLNFYDNRQNPDHQKK